MFRKTKDSEEFTRFECSNRLQKELQIYLFHMRQIDFQTLKQYL